MEQSVYELGTSSYDDVIGWSDMKRDKDGFIRLTPTASHVDRQVEQFTTDIKSLESKLKEYREKKAAAVKYQGSEEYKESKKQEKKSKKDKKKRNTLLEMVFNKTLDEEAEEDDEESESDEANYRDSKKKKSERKKNTTLETTYGKRYSPIVSMLYDSIADFDKIAADIQAELDSPQLRSKNMYRSTQIGNLLTAKDKRLSAIKELSAVATTLSNLEYKREKDKKAEEGSDTTKAISNLGAKFLRGGFDYDGDTASSSGKKSKKKDKKDNKSSKKDKGSRDSFGKPKFIDPDDDDDDYDQPGTVKRGPSKESRMSDDRELASEFAKMLEKRKDEFHFSPHERFMNMEGKYNIVVVGDSLDMEDTWKFIAVDPKSGKEIKGFKDDYPGLLPKRKQCRMTFDLNRLKAYDKNSGKTYKILLSD